MAQSVICPTLNFGSGLDLMVMKSSPTSGSVVSGSVLGIEPTQDTFSLPLLLPLSRTSMHMHVLSQINKNKNKTKQLQNKRTEQVQHIPKCVQLNPNDLTCCWKKWFCEQINLENTSYWCLKTHPKINSACWHIKCVDKSCRKKAYFTLKAFPNLWNHGALLYQNTSEAAYLTASVFHKKRQTLASVGKMMSNVPTKNFQNNL